MALKKLKTIILFRWITKYFHELCSDCYFAGYEKLLHETSVFVFLNVAWTFITLFYSCTEQNSKMENVHKVCKEIFQRC